MPTGCAGQRLSLLTFLRRFAKESDPGLLNPILFISASSSTTRNIRGFGFPGCLCCVTPPSSLKPKPRAFHMGMASPPLSIPAARPIGFGKFRPNNLMGRLGPLKKYSDSLSAQRRCAAQLSWLITMLCASSESRLKKFGLINALYIQDTGGLSR